MANENLRERSTGRYMDSRMDAVCRCGHTLGQHAAEKVNGVRDCFEVDEHGHACECVTYKKAKETK